MKIAKAAKYNPRVNWAKEITNRNAPVNKLVARAGLDLPLIEGIKAILKIK